MGKKRRAKLRGFDIEAMDDFDDFDDFEDLKKDIYSSGWSDAWEEERRPKGRERLAKRDRFADEFPLDNYEWDDDYQIGDWEDNYQPNER